MSALGLPLPDLPDADRRLIRDVNHPRALLVQWRGQKQRAEELMDQAAELGQAGAHMMWAAVAGQLDQCAEQLRHRLEWSGML